jgi:hypothetical protein
LTSRRDLDKPAAVIAAVVGIVIIVVALPFTIAAFPQTPKTFDAAWGEKTTGSRTLTVPTDTGTYKAEVTGTNFQPASIQVDTTVCTDTHDATFQQAAASLHLKLTTTRGASSQVLEDRTFKCPDGIHLGHKLGDHADVTGAQARDAVIAKKIVWLDASLANATGPSTYTLEVTASRPAPGIPTLPVTPAASLGVSLRLTLNAWDAVLNEHQKEVGK